jgi:hypothetical protein
MYNREPSLLTHFGFVHAISLPFVCTEYISVLALGRLYVINYGLLMASIETMKNVRAWNCARAFHLTWSNV